MAYEDDEVVRRVTQRAMARRETIANRIIGFAFAVLLLSTFAAVGLAVRYRDAAVQARTQGCTPATPPTVLVPKRKITS